MKAMQMGLNHQGVYRKLIRLHCDAIFVGNVKHGKIRDSVFVACESSADESFARHF